MKTDRAFVFSLSLQYRDIQGCQVQKIGNAVQIVIKIMPDTDSVASFYIKMWKNIILPALRVYPVVFNNYGCVYVRMIWRRLYSHYLYLLYHQCVVKLTLLKFTFGVTKLTSKLTQLPVVGVTLSWSWNTIFLFIHWVQGKTK